ncbi:MAG: hypothetical protein LBS53_03230 [Synergistaceae bacterium]|nr:hypothetical protein [Synergistaceae bacterium]
MMYMKDTIFYVGGSKGGVGKSMVSHALVQFLIDKYNDQKTIHVIETDDSNPDVGRAYKGKIPGAGLVLDEDERGWLALSDLLDGSRDTLFVINSAARSNMGIRKNGREFTETLRSGGRYGLVTLWPMNRQKDSVLLLEDFLRYVDYGSVYPVLNTYFGNATDFTLYINYLRESDFLESKVTKTLTFPSLSDMIADIFYSGGQTIPETEGRLNALARQYFLTWRRKANAMFEEIEEVANADVTAEGNGEL